MPWSQYAFDPRERPKIGHRSRESTAIAMTEAGVMRETARCLREIAEGRVPKQDVSFPDSRRTERALVAE